MRGEPMPPKEKQMVNLLISMAEKGKLGDSSALFEALPLVGGALRLMKNRTE